MGDSFGLQAQHATYKIFQHLFTEVEAVFIYARVVVARKGCLAVELIGAQTYMWLAW